MKHFFHFLMAVVLILNLANVLNGIKLASIHAGEIYEINTEYMNPTDEFLDNQREANAITAKFFDYLNEKYGTTCDDSIYTVNGIMAGDYPAYYGGAYINTEGHLVVQIEESYYSYDYKESSWYQEFTDIVANDNFYCHPVKYSYSELMDAISMMSLGYLREEFRSLGVDYVEAGIDDYDNCVRVVFRNQEDYDLVIDKIPTDIYQVSVDEQERFFTTDVIPGWGITTSSIGSYTFSVACRVRRNLPYNQHEYGFLTCAHAFVGNSNVYVDSGSSINYLAGTSYSINQKLGGKADVAYVTAASNVTLWNAFLDNYSNPVVLNPSWPSSMGSLVYKNGASSGVTAGIVLDSSHATTISGTTLNDIVKVGYYSQNGDSGGIVFTQPDSNNYADIIGIHSANELTPAGSFVCSFFTKIYNDLAALQSGQITYSLY